LHQHKSVDRKKSLRNLKELSGTQNGSALSQTQYFLI